MADNTGEEHLDNPAINQSENPPDEIIPAADTETINPTQQIENMEVHHHPNLDHKPKKLKEYFLEFLMIFLAVTMGFIAENIREHFVEKETEKKYIKSYLADLKTDSSTFEKIMGRNQITIETIDKTLKLLHSPTINDSVSKSLYELNGKVTGFAIMIFNKRTLSQLKTSGGYKLISNNAISDSMVVRENDIEWSENLAQRLYTLSFEIRTNSANKIFDTYLVYEDLNHNVLQQHLIPDTLFTNNKKFPLLTTTKENIAAYSNNLISLQWNVKNYHTEMRRYQQRCKNLIALIEKEYHLE